MLNVDGKLSTSYTPLQTLSDTATLTAIRLGTFRKSAGAQSTGSVSSKSSTESNSRRRAGSDSVSYASWMALKCSSMAALRASSAAAAPALSGWCSSAAFR